MKYLLSLFLLLFLAACGDDNNDVGTTPQDNCILHGSPQFCNNPFPQGHYPVNNRYWVNYNYNNGAFANLNGCGSGYMPVGHPQWGLNCTPRFHGNFQHISFQGYNLPRSCRTSSQCGGNSYCRIQNINFAGVCHRR